jgi:hypothetical protein
MDTEKIKRYMGRVYFVENNVDNSIYISSTTSRLSVRMGGHRSSARRGRPSKFYDYMRLLGVDKFNIVLIETIEDCTREELYAREAHYKRQMTKDVKKNKIVKPKYRHTKVCLHNIIEDNCPQCNGINTCKHKNIEKSCLQCHPPKHYCETCAKKFFDLSGLKRHKKSKIHREMCYDIRGTVSKSP